MRVLRMAVKRERWDLAAHTIVLAAVRVMNQGDKNHDRENKEKKGAQKGNKNAMKHGFYSRVLDEAERLDFEIASGVEGIDEEIALMRVEIKKAITGGDDRNLRTLVRATNALERLIRTRYQITASQRKGLKDAIGNVIKDIAIPLGISVGNTAIGKRI